jgi:hypothetical protein
MITRAAEQPELWPHLLALAWQIVWVGLILWFAARLFRRSVLKSGPQRKPLLKPALLWLMTALGLAKLAS